MVGAIERTCAAADRFVGGVRFVHSDTVIVHTGCVYDLSCYPIPCWFVHAPVPDEPPLGSRGSAIRNDRVIGDGHLARLGEVDSIIAISIKL